MLQVMKIQKAFQTMENWRTFFNFVSSLDSDYSFNDLVKNLSTLLKRVSNIREVKKIEKGPWSGFKKLENFVAIFFL